VTVIIKAAFFPLANKSYASMAKMKAVQPQMKELRDRYPDDKQKQQQELMHGAKIELWDNIKAVFGAKKKGA
jgi:YidC/Oxa1 family membrane protein insertase